VREIFVYYRVRPANAPDASRAVAAMQRELRALYPGLEARLLTRDENADGAPTWMETYALDRARGSRGVGPDIERAIEAQALPLLPFIDGPRHVEAFHSGE
jgi:hypothetical protein